MPFFSVTKLVLTLPLTMVVYKRVFKGLVLPVDQDKL